jgi:tripartite ATP-independent transporter DctM subunit
VDLHTILVAVYFATFILLLFSGYPVGFVLGGLGLWFALLGDGLNWIGVEVDVGLFFFNFAIGRFFSTMTNINLVPVPMFIFMGIMLDRSGAATSLLKSLQVLFRRIPGGLAIAVTLIGVVLAATTGIIGASVVLLGTLSLPQMLKTGYKRELAIGTIVASGTLGILIPPSIMLLVMADQMVLSVPDLFMAALVPGLLLASLYVLYIVVISLIKPDAAPAATGDAAAMDDRPLGRVILSFVGSLLPPTFLILAVLGSIFFGVATPSEASGVGALGALILAAFYKKVNWPSIKEACHATAKMTAFVFLLIYGAPCFAVVLRGLGGDEVVEGLLMSMAGGQLSMVVFVLTVVFILGFFLDWIEITVILIPLVLPIISKLAIDPYWFAILVAVCLQTSFLTPPMGPALFYVQGITPKEIRIEHIYRGVIPFVAIQIVGIVALILWPSLATWLPGYLSR